MVQIISINPCIPLYYYHLSYYHLYFYHSSTKHNLFQIIMQFQLFLHPIIIKAYFCSMSSGNSDNIIIINKQNNAYDPVDSVTTEVNEITDNSLAIEERVADKEVLFKNNNSKKKMILVFLGLAMVSLLLVFAWFAFSQIKNKINQEMTELQIKLKTNSLDKKIVDTDGSSSTANKQFKKQNEPEKQINQLQKTQVEIKMINEKQQNKKAQEQQQNIAKLKKREEQFENNPSAHTPFTEHIHSPLKFAYPTMGMPTPNTTFNFTPVRPDQYKKYEERMDELFKPHNDSDCELERYGDHGDGGYLICKNYVNNSVALVNLGVQGRDLFGCELTSSFPMPNYQYDCTNNYRTTCASNKQGNIFDLGCLGQKSQKKFDKQFYTLKDIVDSRNLTHKHVTMKIDIEGAEWPGFRTFPIEYLDYVDQFVLQIHNPGRGMSQGTYWGNLDIIDSLKERFVSVNLHMNTGSCFGGDRAQRHFPAFAIEVSLVNKKVIKLKSQSRSYAMNSKNQLNGGGINCQMTD